MAKIGLALGGGGAKGSYQIGVFKALIEYGLLDKIDTISGTSIGALNATLVMGQMPFDGMVDFWKSMNNKVIYGGLVRYKDDRLGFFDQTLMYKELIKKQKTRYIKNSQIDGYVILTKTENPKLLTQLSRKSVKPRIVHLNTSRNPYKFVLASASVPVVFGPTKIGNDYFVDGGLVDNLPVEILIEKGCNIILTIGLRPDYTFDEFKDNALIIDFSPTKKIGKTILSMLNFNPKYIENRIDLGYLQSKELINKLKLSHVLLDDDSFDETLCGVHKL